MRKSPVVCAAAVAASMFIAAGASAAVAPDPTEIHLSYDVTTSVDPGAATIYDIATYNTYDDGSSGVWWPSSIDASGGTIADPFVKSVANRPLTGLLMGLVKSNDASNLTLPDDATPGQIHLVLMIDNTAAAAADGQPWGTSFNPTVGESELIGHIQFTMEHDRGTLDPAGQAQWDASFAAMSGFADANPGLAFALAAPSPWLTTTSDFTVMAWSNGQILGSGVANVAQVPEVSTYAMMALGLGVVAYARRRRRER